MEPNAVEMVKKVTESHGLVALVQLHECTTSHCAPCKKTGIRKENWAHLHWNSILNVKNIYRLLLVVQGYL
jgi:hypothetical protein